MSTNNFLPESFIIPEEAEEKDLRIREYLNKISKAVNTKDSGFYEEEEVITGQQFVPIFSSDSAVNAEYRDVFRKVIDFGALPSNTIKSVPHEISITNDFSIVKLYGTATHADSSIFHAAIPIPYVNVPVPAQGVQLSMDNVNIIIETKQGNFDVYNRCFIIVEYMKFA